MILSQEVKDQIRKDVQNEIALNDAIYIMENYLQAPEHFTKEHYRARMEEFINKQKSK